MDTHITIHDLRLKNTYNSEIKTTLRNKTKERVSCSTQEKMGANGGKKHDMLSSQSLYKLNDCTVCLCVCVSEKIKNALPSKRTRIGRLLFEQHLQ